MEYILTAWLADSNNLVPHVFIALGFIFIATIYLLVAGGTAKYAVWALLTILVATVGVCVDLAAHGFEH
jgi:hypothetical protein